jgi:protein-S-isoprenylcysteine O-methyltransferase Ste14
MVVWIILFGLFIAFIPFYRKSQKRPASVYIAFVIALALEMFGISLSMYVVSWVFGITLPVGTLWGHTLQQYIGYWGMYIGFALNLVGAYLVVQGWRNIHKYYWRNDEGKGTLVTNGIYTYIRHPQYTGFLLITLGLLVHWATIPLLVMWPILVLQYYRLAKREERKLEKEFGDKYKEYRKKVPMFIPHLI